MREAASTSLKLRVTAAAEKALRAGHPWLFAGSIRERSRVGERGEIAVIYDRRNRFLAAGLYDPDSPLQVRILVANRPEAITPDWWRQRLQAALDRRAGLFDPATTGYRCINGESDGWPGLVLDRYGGCLALKLYTAAWLPRLPALAGLIGNLLQPDQLVLRLSRNIQTLARSEFQRLDGEVLQGERTPENPVFLETGLRFEAQVYGGQKTGFFLDQRENRRRVEALSAGRRVLNTFSFSGGFSLYAARGGARAVTDVDISPHALAGARRNFSLNRDHPAVAACPYEQAQADVFAWLAQSPERYDLVVLDPPSLARREAERAGALQAYGKLVSAAIRRLAAGGLLVAASCSAHVSAKEFFGVVRQSARRSGRRFQERETTGHAADHPAAFPEAQYLKCIYLEF